jgi:hypothetical protein
MRRLRNGFLLALAFAAALAVSGGAGAAPSTRSAAERFDLTTRTGVDKYLASIGLDRAGLTVQRGARNYAGAHCPGKRWNCTKVRRVLQIATRAGANEFECSPSTGVGGAATSPDFCIVVQVVPATGNNTARCVEKDAPDGSQYCRIEQANATGNNYAYVEQVLKQSGTSATGSQTSDVDQQNVSGKNQAFVRQTIVQSSTDSAEAAAQSQNGTQDSSVNQVASGVEAPALAGLVLTSSPLYGLSPVFGEPGQQHAHGDQSLTQNANAPNADTGTQDQEGNVIGTVDQDSPGVSRNLNRQSEYQTESAPMGSDVMQSQDGPLNCCTEQGTNEKDAFNIDQHSTQKATSDAAEQTDLILGQCMTTGVCSVDQFVNQDGEHETNSCTDSTCAIGIFCALGEACAPCTIGGEGGCPSPPSEEFLVSPARPVSAKAAIRS